MSSCVRGRISVRRMSPRRRIIGGWPTFKCKSEACNFMTMRKSFWTSGSFLTSAGALTSGAGKSSGMSFKSPLPSGGFGGGDIADLLRKKTDEFLFQERNYYVKRTGTPRSAR
jgi:hypothetical protein